MDDEKIIKALKPIEKSYLLVFIFLILNPLIILFSFLSLPGSSGAGAILMVLFIFQIIQGLPILLPLLMVISFSISFFKLYKELFFDYTWKDETNSSTLMMKASIFLFIIGIIVQIFNFPNLLPPQDYFKELIVFFYGGSFFYFLTSSLLLINIKDKEMKNSILIAFGVFGLSSSVVSLSFFLRKSKMMINGFHLSVIFVLGIAISYLFFYRVFIVLENGKNKPKSKIKNQ